MFKLNKSKHLYAMFTQLGDYSRNFLLITTLNAYVISIIRNDQCG